MVSVHVECLKKTYMAGDQLVEALAGVNLSIGAGEFVAVVGYSGCGKTTLLRHLGGLEKPDSGSVVFERADSSIGDLLRAEMGVMFQEPRLLPWLSVGENLDIALHRESAEIRKTRIRKVLEQVRLDDFINAYPTELSGGMAQRVALARVLCRKPKIMLMDEPFGALDALTRLQLQDELADICRKQAITVLFITHDIREAVKLSDRIVVMDTGRIKAEIETSLECSKCGDSRQQMCRNILNIIVSEKDNGGVC